jgi:hypothetical protein
MHRQRGEREQPADHTRRNERTMARGSERIAPRRRMHERLVISADLRGKIHNTLDTPVTQDALPYSPDRVRGRLSER